MICSLDMIRPEKSVRTRRLIILGASGSVGGTALSFVRTLSLLKPSDPITLTGISVHSSVNTLRKILSEFSPKYACITHPETAAEHMESLKAEFSGVLFFSGEAGVLAMLSEAAATENCDTVLTAVVGSSGIRATVKSIELGFKIALANKETLVTAGPAIQALLKKMGDRAPCIMPVDSEHNSLFQLLQGKDQAHIKRIILTASGGPFAQLPLSEIRSMGVNQVLSHPTWQMGPKITVDSAGMINKGLEVIEAHYLFGAPYDTGIGVYIHRKSIVHSMIQMKDGSYQLGASAPDMIYPVAHALLYPEPLPVLHEISTDPPSWPALEFADVSLERYPGFRMALEAGRTGGTAAALFNGANEAAVSHFLKGIIGFTDIPALIEMVLNTVSPEYGEEAGLYTEADARARALVDAKALKRTFG